MWSLYLTNILYSISNEMSTVSTAAKNWMVKSIIYREVIFFGKVNLPSVYTKKGRSG